MLVAIFGQTQSCPIFGFVPCWLKFILFWISMPTNSTPCKYIPFLLNPQRKYWFCHLPCQGVPDTPSGNKVRNVFWTPKYWCKFSILMTNIIHIKLHYYGPFSMKFPVSIPGVVQEQKSQVEEATERNQGYCGWYWKIVIVLIMYYQPHTWYWYLTIIYGLPKNNNL